MVHKFSLRVKIFIVLLFVFHDHFSQGFLKTQGKKIVDENGEEVILRGMGLGGWMLQEGYMMLSSGFANTQHELKKKITDLAGPEATEDFYNRWLQHYLSQADVDSLSSWGFNSIRLPMHYNLYTLPIEKEPLPGKQTWLETGFILTDSLLAWCSRNHMYLILDLHAAPGGQGKDAAISDYDPTKPSLWENKANRDKTVALWKKLADRYKDHPWVGGYDLINETNWDLPDNQLLLQLYREITDSIRTVDKNHILFIEGNWWANDFTGLTPPWDDQMVYSFHKYWSYNTTDVLQWVLDLRDTYNVPIWLGESGENSNTWFTDCIRLAENYGIGWAWWTYKRMESITSPLSIAKNPGYQTLLDYWSGNGARPEAEKARSALIDLTENLKTANCRFNQDVVHAMMKSTQGEGPVPYTLNQVPGIVFATDYDMGEYNQAWYDRDLANYQVSTGNYTAWNSGWSYRNDGVDIEPCSDPANLKLFNVGWINDGEWMLYTVKADTAGYYRVITRVASENTGGRFHLEKDGVPLFDPVEVVSTGGYQKWQDLVSETFYLESGQYPLRFVTDRGGFNAGYFKFDLVSINSLTDEEAPSDFHIFPNPTRGLFSVQNKKFLYGPVKLEVFNTSGQIVYSLHSDTPERFNQIDISGAKGGLYIVVIHTGSKTTTCKLMLNR